MSSPLSAVTLPPTVGRARPPGGRSWDAGPGDDEDAPATPAPSPRTAAMAPPAMAALRLVDEEQRQRALPRGCGRWVAVGTCPSTRLLCMACAPVRGPPGPPA